VGSKKKGGCFAGKRRGKKEWGNKTKGGLKKKGKWLQKGSRTKGGEAYLGRKKLAGRSIGDARREQGLGE